MSSSEIRDETDNEFLDSELGEFLARQTGFYARVFTHVCNVYECVREPEGTCSCILVQ